MAFKMNSLLPYAVAATVRGFHVFPVDPMGKQPARIHQDRPEDEAPWRIRWSDAATTDLDRIADWWAYCPRANVGIACKPSGLLVVDCDMPKQAGHLDGTRWEYLHAETGMGRIPGELVFQEMAIRYGGKDAWKALHSTHRVTTGSGGTHYYFRWPEGVKSSQDSPLRGLIDVRGNGGDRGGYVLAPGSVTEKGRYQRAVDAVSAEPVPAPEWLVKLCRYREPYKPPPGPYSQPRAFAFGGLVETVARAQAGNRNNALLWAARSMCEDGASLDEATEKLESAAQSAGLDDQEIRQTIRSAYRLQKGKAS